MKLTFLIMVLLICFCMGLASNDYIRTDYTKLIHTEVFPIIISPNMKEFITNLELTEQYNVLYVSSEEELNQLNTTIIQKDIEKEINNNKVIGDEIEVTFHLKDDPNQTKATLRFFSSQIRYYNSSQLALPFIFKDKSLSLIHQYYSKGLINHLSFSMVRNGNDGIIYFGGIPEEAKLNRIHSFCNVKGTNNYWDCEIKQIKLQGTTHIQEYTINTTNNLVLFDTNTDFVFVPSSFIDFLYEYYTSLDLEIFITTGNTYQKRQLYAWHSSLFKANLHITIDNFGYDIDLDELWMCYEIHCYLQIIENPKGEMWTFTMGFYDKYNIMFDYEEKKIHFYSLKGVKPIESNSIFSIKHTKLLVMTNLLLFVVGFGVLYLIKARNG